MLYNHVIQRLTEPFLLCKPVSLTILFSAELGNIDRGRGEIRLKLTDFCYTDSTSWDQDTCYLFHRHVSHLAGNVDKSMACRERLLFSAELGNIDRGRGEIRLKLTDFCYTDSTSWDQDTCYLFHRHVSHLVGNVDKSMACRERLRSLDVSRMGEEAKIIFKCVISEMPQSARFLSPSSIKALLSVRPLDKRCRSRPDFYLRPASKPCFP